MTSTDEGELLDKIADLESIIQNAYELTLMIDNPGVSIIRNALCPPSVNVSDG